jgi:hypothetical protein
MTNFYVITTTKRQYIVQAIGEHNAIETLEKSLGRKLSSRPIVQLLRDYLAEANYPVLVLN